MSWFTVLLELTGSLKDVFELFAHLLSGLVQFLRYLHIFATLFFRAGTTGTMLLMHLQGRDSGSALQEARCVLLVFMILSKLVVSMLFYPSRLYPCYLIQVGCIHVILSKLVVPILMPFQVHFSSPFFPAALLHIFPLHSQFSFQINNPFSYIFLNFVLNSHLILRLSPG